MIRKLIFFYYRQDPNCFHRAIGGILLVAQFLGILPITGVCEKSVYDMKMQKQSLRFFYACFILFSLSLMTCASLKELFGSINNLIIFSGFDYFLKEITDTATKAAFYGNNLLSHFLFLKLCTGWIAVQHDWRFMEKKIDE